MTTQSNPDKQPEKTKVSKRRGGQKTKAESLSISMSKVDRTAPAPLSEERRRELIAVAAYYFAEHRGFETGHEEEDWLAAEAQVDSLGVLMS